MAVLQGENGQKKNEFKELAEIQSISGKRLKRKAISSFLGDVGLIKVVLEFSFGHRKCHFSVPENGHFWQKYPPLHA